MSRPRIPGFPAARVVDALEVEELAPGRKHQLFVEAISDGLGRPMHIPVLVARGAKPGPVFGLTAAIHGNELNGIPVLHRLFETLDTKTLRGTVVGVLVLNIPGFLQHQREFNDGRDLNHRMPGRADGAIGPVYAHRFFDRIVRRFDFLVDLHTASFGRVNSLYIRSDMMHPVASQMAYLFRPQIILHNPASDRTLRGAAMDAGIPAITVEIADPQRFQPKYIRWSLTGIRAILAEHGLISRKVTGLGPAPILCESSHWIYTDEGGLLEVLPGVTDRVKDGQVLARLMNIFGELTREYRAPHDGVIIGKSVNPVGQTGARIVHLGFEAEAGLLLGRKPPKKKKKKKAARSKPRSGSAPRPKPASKPELKRPSPSDNASDDASDSEPGRDDAGEADKGA